MGMSVAGGGGGSRRGRRGRRGSSGPMSEINVTPLVDVMLVLLIVFMVAAPLMTVGVPIDLPETRAQQLNTESEPITVTVTSSGQVYIEEDEIPFDQLVATVQSLTEAGTEERIFVRGDNLADYGSVMRVMGALSGAGFTKIGLITDQEQGQ